MSCYLSLFGLKILAHRPIQSLVLENLSHSFLKPNILDIKLGTVLYDETASPEKVARMVETAKNTTSFEAGVRLTGFQVSDVWSVPSEIVLSLRDRCTIIAPDWLLIPQNHTANPSPWQTSPMASPVSSLSRPENRPAAFHLHSFFLSSNTLEKTSPRSERRLQPSR